MLPVLTVAGVLLVTAQMHRFGGGVIAGEQHRVYDLGAGEIGLIMGAMPLASAVVQVPVGLAFDRFGTRLCFLSPSIPRMSTARTRRSPPSRRASR
jgi:MFS family permease